MKPVILITTFIVPLTCLSNALAQSDVYKLNYKERALIKVIAEMDQKQLFSGEECFLVLKSSKSVFSVIDDFTANEPLAKTKYKDGAIIRFNPTSIRSSPDGIYFKFGNINYEIIDLFSTRVFLNQAYDSYAKSFKSEKAVFSCAIKKGMSGYQFLDCQPALEKYQKDIIKPINDFLSKEKHSSQGANHAIQILTLSSLLPADSACFMTPLNIKACQQSISYVMNNDRSKLRTAAKNVISKLEKLGYKTNEN